VIVITRIRPRFFTLSTDQLVPVDNPYLMVYDNTNEAAPHTFQVRVDGGSIGEAVALTENVGSGGAVAGGGGLSVADDLADLVGWQCGQYAAYVRAGGRFRVTSNIVSAVAAAGNTIPDFVGVEVGGFRVSQDRLRRYLKS